MYELKFKVCPMVIWSPWDLQICLDLVIQGLEFELGFGDLEFEIRIQKLRVQIQVQSNYDFTTFEKGGRLLYLGLFGERETNHERIGNKKLISARVLDSQQEEICAKRIWYSWWKEDECFHQGFVTWGDHNIYTWGNYLFDIRGSEEVQAHLNLLQFQI